MSGRAGAPLPPGRRLALDLSLGEGDCFEEAAGRLARLTTAEEEALLSVLLEQRLAPWVAWRLWGEGGQGRTPPPPLGLTRRLAEETDWWKEETRRQRLVLLQTSRLLAEAGIEVIALKGADLAWNLYPQPWLRPQRDLDLLVPEPLLAKAVELLERGGYRLESGSRRPRQRAFWWHLHCNVIHPLGVRLELHRALWREPLDRRPLDFSLRPDFGPPGGSGPLAAKAAAYRRRIGEITYLAPAYLHLHCLVHHLHSHRTNVGPLGLQDLKLLGGWEAVDRQTLARECAAIGAPGLVAAAAALIAWGSGLPPENAQLPAPELLFMDRHALFGLQMRARPPLALLRAWWTLHRRDYRWRHDWPRQPLITALLRALIVLPALVLRAGPGTLRRRNAFGATARPTREAKARILAAERLERALLTGP